MYSLISGLFNWYFNKPIFELLIIGEEKAGKTTYLEQLNHLYTGYGTPIDFIVPTTGLNITRFKYNDTEFNIRDPPGKESLRKLWTNFYNDIDGLIYIVDASSPNLKNSLDILNDVLKNKVIKMEAIPVLILINKTDLIECDTQRLKTIYESIDYSQFDNKHFIVKDISAKKGERLEGTMAWLYNSIMDNNKEEKDINGYINLV